MLREPRFLRANPDYMHRRPCVYVGMTGLSPDERFDKHKAGIKSNKFVRLYGLRLLPGAVRGLQPDALRGCAGDGGGARHRAARRGLRRVAGLMPAHLRFEVCPPSTARRGRSKKKQGDRVALFVTTARERASVYALRLRRLAPNASRPMPGARSMPARESSWKEAGYPGNVDPSRRAERERGARDGAVNGHAGDVVMRNVAVRTRKDCAGRCRRWSRSRSNRCCQRPGGANNEVRRGR